MCTDSHYMIAVSCIVSVTILGLVQTEHRCTENQLRAGRPRGRRPIPGRGVHFSLLQRLNIGSEGLPAFYLVRSGGSLLRDMKLTAR